MLEVGLEQARGFGFAVADGDFDAGGAELFDALAGDLGVGVEDGDVDGRDAGGDEGVGAGRRAAVEVVRVRG